MDTEANTDWIRNDFDLAGIPGFPGTIILGEAYNTPGAPNAIYVPPLKHAEIPSHLSTRCRAVGLSSPLVGTEVAVEGVVVGDFQNITTLDNGNLNGFHIQDPTGDGNACHLRWHLHLLRLETWRWLVGDKVRVRGMVSEYNGMTEITASKIWICSSGNSITPTVLSLPVASVNDFEPFEGMLVTFPQSLVISEYFNFDRYGEIVLTSKRSTHTPTAVVEPGATLLAAAETFLRIKSPWMMGAPLKIPTLAIHPNGSVL